MCGSISNSDQVLGADVLPAAQVGAGDIFLRKPLKEIVIEHQVGKKTGMLIRFPVEQIELPVLLKLHASKATTSRLLISCNCGQGYCHQAYCCPGLEASPRSEAPHLQRAYVKTGHTKLAEHLTAVHEKDPSAVLVLKCATVGNSDGSQPPSLLSKPMFWHLKMEFDTSSNNNQIAAGEQQRGG